MKTESKISKTYNAILFIFLFFNILLEYLFEPEVEESTPWDAIYNISPVMSVIVMIVFIFIIVFGVAKLFQIFWNSFISDIFKVRNIAFQESLAIILISGILFG